MKCFVFKQRRRIDGKIVVSACYSGRYRLAGEFRDTTVRLDVSDKQAAESKLRKHVQELEREGQGLIPVKKLRDGGHPAGVAMPEFQIRFTWQGDRLTMRPHE